MRKIVQNRWYWFIDNSQLTTQNSPLFTCSVTEVQIVIGTEPDVFFLSFFSHQGPSTLVRRRPLSSCGRSFLSDSQTSWKRSTCCPPGCSRHPQCKWCRVGEWTHKKWIDSNVSDVMPLLVLFSFSTDSLWTASAVLYLIRQQLRRLFTSSRSVLFSAVADESELNSFQLALLWGREALGPELSPSFSPSHVTLFFKRVLFPLVWPNYRPERKKTTFEGNI